MHVLTIYYTEAWVVEDFRKAWRDRHAEPGEPDWSARLATVQWEIRGCIGILREIQRNKAWWEKPKRTAREIAVWDAQLDLARYIELTGVSWKGSKRPQMWDQSAFEALERGEAAAVAACKAWGSMLTFR
jgi:hypothetical protein